MNLKKILFIFYILFVLINCEEEEEDSEDICECEKSENQTCCQFEIDEIIECKPFETKYLFAINFLNDIVNITCKKEHEALTCGTNHPKKLFQCREHSSKSNTCCMININGETNCILADSKFIDLEENYYGKEFDLYNDDDSNRVIITCNEKFIYLKRKNNPFNLFIFYFIFLLFYL